MKSIRIKAQQLETRAEFNAAVDAAANYATMIAYIEARRDKAIVRLQQKFGEKIAPLAVQRDAQVQLAETYADAHRKELLPKDRKSADIPTATFGWREGNRTVQVLQKLKADAVVAKLKEVGLASYVRTTEEIAKDKILADCRNGKTIPLAPKTEGGRRRHVATARASLRITQGETFFIQPKVETIAAVKTAAA